MSCRDKSKNNFYNGSSLKFVVLSICPSLHKEISTLFLSPLYQQKFYMIKLIDNCHHTTVHTLATESMKPHARPHENQHAVNQHGRYCDVAYFSMCRYIYIHACWQWCEWCEAPLNKILACILGNQQAVPLQGSLIDHQSLCIYQQCFLFLFLTDEQCLIGVAIN